jgi:hypothetical protein
MEAGAMAEVDRWQSVVRRRSLAIDHWPSIINGRSFSYEQLPAPDLDLPGPEYESSSTSEDKPIAKGADVQSSRLRGCAPRGDLLFGEAGRRNTNTNDRVLSVN